MADDPVTAERAAFVSSEFRSAVFSNPLTQVTYGKVARDTKDEPVDTFFDSVADAQIVVEARGAILSAHARRFRTTVDYAVGEDEFSMAETLPAARLIDTELSADLDVAIYGLDNVDLDGERSVLLSWGALTETIVGPLVREGVGVAAGSSAGYAVGLAHEQPTWLPAGADSGINFKLGLGWFNDTLVTDLSTLLGGDYKAASLSSAGYNMAVTNKDNTPRAIGALLARMAKLDWAARIEWDQGASTDGTILYMGESLTFPGVRDRFYAYWTTGSPDKIGYGDIQGTNALIDAPAAYTNVVLVLANTTAGWVGSVNGGTPALAAGQSGRNWRLSDALLFGGPNQIDTMDATITGLYFYSNAKSVSSSPEIGSGGGMALPFGAGSAQGAGSATATGRVIAAAVGAAAGSGAVAGAGAAVGIFSSVASASGSGSASATGSSLTTATPTFVSVGTTANSVGTNSPATSSVAVPYPGSGVAVDRIAIIQFFYNDQNLTTPTATIATPSGWTAIGAQVDQLGMSSMAFWKRLVGTESGTVTVTQTGGAGAGVSSRQAGGVMSIWDGCTTSGSPIEDPQSASGNGTAATGPTVTTSGTNRRVVSLMNVWLANNNSAPSGSWTERLDATPTSANKTLVVSDIEVLAAGAQSGDARTLTSSARWITHGFALKP